MLNSISLSSDQTSVFLIDNGEAIEFPLEEDNGVLIGHMGGQLTTASAPDATPANAVSLPFALDTEADQWQITFNPDRSLLHIIGQPKQTPETEGDRTIGATDVDPGRSIGATDVDPGRTIGSTDVDPGRGAFDESRKHIQCNLATQVVHLIKEGNLIKVNFINK